MVVVVRSAWFINALRLADAFGVAIGNSSLRGARSADFVVNRRWTRMDADSLRAHDGVSRDSNGNESCRQIFPKLRIVSYLCSSGFICGQNWKQKCPGRLSFRRLMPIHALRARDRPRSGGGSKAARSWRGRRQRGQIPVKIERGQLLADGTQIPHAEPSPHTRGGQQRAVR